MDAADEFLDAVFDFLTPTGATRGLREDRRAEAKKRVRAAFDKIVRPQQPLTIKITEIGGDECPHSRQCVLKDFGNMFRDGHTIMRATTMCGTVKHGHAPISTDVAPDCPACAEAIRLARV